MTKITLSTMLKNRFVADFIKEMAELGHTRESTIDTAANVVRIA